MKTIIDTLSSKEKELLIYREMNMNEIIFQEGEVAKYVGIVISGALTIESHSLEGSLITFNNILPGNMFGHNLIFSNEQHYLGNVKARVKSSLYLISKENVTYLLQSNKSFLEAFMNLESEFTKAINQKLKIISLPLAKERIIYYLFAHNGKVKITSISYLASSLGLSRETTSRTITSLIKEGKIKREGNTLSLMN